jgi:hypothetical protein
VNKKYKDWIRHVYIQRENNEFGKLTLYRNEEGRLHRDNGPAYVSPTTLIHYRNGLRHGKTCDVWGSITYFFDGVRVPKRYVTNPENLTFDEVLTHSNAEVRAIGIRIYGFERMLREERFEVIHIDSKKERMLLKFNAKDLDESFCVVRVFNSTLELNGDRNIYYLMVPPNMKTCQEAVAWTFYKKADDYQPVVET